MSAESDKTALDIMKDIAIERGWLTVEQVEEYTKPPHLHDIAGKPAFTFRGVTTVLTPDKGST